MKQKVIIAGVGMTRFARHLDRNLKSLAGEAITAAIEDAGISSLDLQAAYMANAAAAVITGQICVPGEVVLRELKIGKIPVINIENACASASTAFNQACAMITAGLYEVVLACGYEKLFHEDKQKTFSAFTGAVDIENLDVLMQQIQQRMAEFRPGADTSGAGSERSMFMDIYAASALSHMKKYGTTQAQFAAVSVKNSVHGSLNPRAQYQQVLTLDEVLSAREISYPLTLPMCSPVGDGAAAVVLVSEQKAKQLGITNPVRVLSSVLHSGWDYAPNEENARATELCALEAFDEAGIGPDDLSCVELHDASAPAEIIIYEELGFCARGEGGKLIDQGHTQLGGKLPVNTSGGLLRKGHPIGATGIAQIVELTDQLRGRADKRQVDNARFALAENGGGYIGTDAAAVCVSILGS